MTTAGTPRDQMTRITTYAEVEEVLSSQDFAAALHSRRSYPIAGDCLLALTHDEHRARRRSEIIMFNKRSLMDYELDLVAPAVQETLDLAAARPDRRIDLMSATNNALLRVSARIVGLDGVDSYADVQELRDLAVRLGEGASVEWSTDPDGVMAAALTAKAEFERRFWRPSRERRGLLVDDVRAGRRSEDELPDDLLTILLRQWADGVGDWDEDRLLREGMFFLVASASTTTHSAPHTLEELERWLVDHEEDRALLGDLAFLQRAVSEALRLHPPVPELLRTAIVDVTLSTDRVLRAGEAVALDLDRANRDQAVFGPDADFFDPHRVPVDRTHRWGVSFGAGPHACPGRMVAVGGGNGQIRSADANVGVLVRIMQLLYARDVRLVDDHPPVRRADTAADRYAEFPVVVGPGPQRPAAARPAR